MKKKIFLLLAIVAALTLVFVACKDPQTPEETTPVVTDAPTDPTETPTETPTTPDETPTEKPTEQVTTEEVTTETPTEPETLPYVEPSAAGVINQAYDTFKVNGNSYFKVDGECHVKLDEIDNAIAFESAKDVQSIGLRGWIGFPQAIVNFGYFVNDGEFVFDDSFTAPTEDAIKIPTNGGEHGSRYEITIPGEALSGGENTIGFVIKLADETVVLLHKTIKVTLPTPIPDITNKFESNVGDYEDGVDIKNTDIGNYFTVEYGAADPHKVEGGNYCFGGINDMYTAADGLYAYTINFTQADATAMMFVRGTKVVHSVDLPVATASEFPINNYYESDGDGTMGGAGIYAALYGGKLNIMVKVYNPDNNSHIGNKKFSVPTDATELTIADDGSTIYFIAGGKLLATIDLAGETSYEKLVDLAEGVTFSKTAVVTLATGENETIEDTLVVSTFASDLGIAVRPAAVKFTSLKVVGFSEITVPSDMEEVTPPEPEKYPIFSEKKDYITHVNTDVVFQVVGGVDTPFFSGPITGWDSVATVTDSSVTTIGVNGWVGFKNEFGQFGYVIDDGEPVYDDNFYNPVADGDPVINAAKSTGADDGGRFKFSVNVEGLTGTHTVRLLYKAADGNAVTLLMFTVNMPDAA